MIKKVRALGDGGGGKRVFLETTIHIDRFWQTSERRREIRANLVGNDLCTSTYVRMEFQRTLLRDIAYVYSIVRSDCETSADGKVFLGELLRKLTQRKGAHSDRAVTRSCLVVACILDHFPDHHSLSRSELLEYLAYLLEFYAEQFYEVDLFLEGGEILRIACSNLTDCDLVKDDLAGEDRRRFHCQRSTAMCQLPAFLARHAELLEKVRIQFEGTGGAKSEGDLQPKVAAAAGRILGGESIDWHVAKGQKNCWPLGDTIISLEAPEDSEIYTTDHHYRVICPIVGRSLFEERVRIMKSKDFAASSEASEQTSA